MNATMKTTVSLTVLLLVIWWFWWRGNESLPRHEAGAAAVGGDHPPSAAAPKSTATRNDGKAAVGQVLSGATDLEVLRQELSRADDQSWIAAYPMLMRLSALELYELLRRPEIIAQPQAQRLLNFVDRGCAVALRELEVGVPSEKATSQPFNREWCRELLPSPNDGIDHRNWIHGQTPGELAAQEPFEFDKAQLGFMGGIETAEGKALLAAQSKEVLQSSRDPFLLRHALDNLFDVEHPALIPDADAWRGLPHSQQSYVRLAAQALAACEAVRNCGPGPLLSDYCSMVPGVNCQPGMGLMQVAQNSLSANQWVVLTGILNEIRRQRASPSGP